jgi:hypothetical protein
MHSTIFDEEGPTTKSLYTAEQQKDLYEKRVLTGIRQPADNQPQLNMPSPQDIKITQNAGHGVVIPSGGGIAAIPQNNCRGMDVPRTSDKHVLVTDGEPMHVVRASQKDDVAIPKEFWGTSVNLHWSDPRIEMSRRKNHEIADRSGIDAKACKMQELSSEMFGKERLTNVSTTSPKDELLAETLDRLHFDSSFERRTAAKNGDRDASSRKVQNLSNSQHNTLPGVSQEYPLSPREVPHKEEHDGDADARQRRRTEKNYSNLFNSEMAPRQEVRGKREEIIGAANSSYLDTRCEIGHRNKSHWGRGEEEGDGSRPNARKQAFLNSDLFGYERPDKPEVEPATASLIEGERVCWDTRNTMELGAEVARRARTKDWEEESKRTAGDRKQEFLASTRVREGLGAPVLAQTSPRTSPKVESFAGSVNPKNMKIASLQSSIFS